MSFQNNKKFLYLLSLFNKKTNHQIETTLLNIQHDFINPIIKPIEQYSRANVLEQQFGYLIKKYTKLNTKSLIPPPTFIPDKKHITILKQTGISKYFETPPPIKTIESIKTIHLETIQPVVELIVVEPEPLVAIQPVVELIRVEHNPIPVPIAKHQWSHDILNILSHKYLILEFNNSITDVYSVGLLGALSDEFYTMPYQPLFFSLSKCCA